MKENRWRSLSIMDLHLTKRGSFQSTASSVHSAASTSRPQSEVPLTNNGQSYELIKSTQVSFYKTLNSFVIGVILFYCLAYWCGAAGESNLSWVHKRLMFCYAFLACTIPIVLSQVQVCNSMFLGLAFGKSVFV